MANKEFHEFTAEIQELRRDIFVLKARAELVDRYERALKDIVANPPDYQESRANWNRANEALKGTESKS